MSDKNDVPVSLMTGNPCTTEDLSELRHIDFFVETRPFYRSVRFYIRGKNPHLDHPTKDEYHIAYGLMLRKFVPSISYRETFDAEWDACQHLMDQLWKIGIRPSEKLAPSPDALKATERHLEDMQRLVFDRKETTTDGK